MNTSLSRGSCIVLGCFALALSCASPKFPESSRHPLLGRSLPRILHRATLDGRPFDDTELAGRVVLVKFFADYCAPCKTTLPAAERLHESHKAVVGVDEDESSGTANAVAQHFGLTFPVIHDADNVLSGRFRVTTMPMTFVTDTTGIIRWVGDEGQTEDQIQSALDAASN